MIKYRNIFSILIILSIAFLSYFNTFTNSFHFDDFKYIVNNEGLKEDFQHVFLSYLCFPTCHDILSNLSNRPIIFYTLHLNHSLGGFNVFGFHVVNLTVHIITCLLIFLFAKEILSINRFLKTSDQSKNKLNIPLISALLFAVHPMNTQVITYITGRTTSIAVCFYMASFLFFIKGVRQNLPWKILFYALSIVFLIMGYGSKMIILTVPVMFIIYYLFFTPLKSIFFKRFFESIFIRIIIQTIVITSPFILIFISSHLNILSFFRMDFGFLQKLFDPIQIKLMHIDSMAKDNLSMTIYLLTEFKVIVFYYIKMIFFPFNQNIDPDFPVAHGITDSGVALSLGVILLCLFAGIYFYKNNRIIAFGIFWFFITLLPTSSILPLRDMITEHRLYLPLAGFILTIPLCLNQFIIRYKKSSFKQLAYFILPVFLLIIVFSVLTVKRNFVWKNEKSLWSDAAEKSPRLPRPLNNLAEAYDKEGLAYDNKKNYKKAIEFLKKAIAISPTGYKYYNNLGKIYGRLGEFELATKNLKLALKYNPDYPFAHYNFGKVYELRGMLDNAIEEYSTAFKQTKDVYGKKYFFEACFNLANVYDKKGEYKKALDTYLNCRKLKPSFPKIYFAIGNIFIKTGNLDEAFKYYSRAVGLDRNYHLAKIAVANVFVMKGKFSKAIEIYQQVIKSDPSNFNVHNNLGLVFLQQMNDPAQAAYHLKKSLDISPDQQKAVLLRELIKNINKDT
ncbi:MAG TPA: tetratricopeptide repeat protein [Nitrospinota bacterium]|jgi:tetratricopeptide (TPR) repeat protein|nr:tetratricopeptide repeat protein [Nitrospinota bacterium]